MNVIAVRQIFKILSRDKKQAESQKKYASETTPDEDLSTDMNEKISWIWAQFDGLSLKQKQILTMRYVEGMQVIDIADKLGVTRFTVSRHISSALAQLKDRAKHEGLLSVILPWRWNGGGVVSKLILRNAYTEVFAVVVVLVLISWGGSYALPYFKTQTTTSFSASSMPPANMQNTPLVDVADVERKQEISHFVERVKLGDVAGHELLQRQPTEDRYWEQLGLDMSMHPEIKMYRIKWSTGWSEWFVPGESDLDHKDKTRRLWSYFTDHLHEVIVDVK